MKVNRNERRLAKSYRAIVNRISNSRDNLDKEVSKGASTASKTRNLAASLMKAGEIDDNENWEEYLRFINSYQGQSRHQLDERTRRIITVSDENGKPVSNTRVTVQNSTVNEAPVSRTP